MNTKYTVNECTLFYGVCVLGLCREDVFIRVDASAVIIMAVLCSGTLLGKWDFKTQQAPKLQQMLL